MIKKKSYGLTQSPFYRVSSLHVLAQLLSISLVSLRRGSKLYSKYYFGTSTNQRGKIRNTETPYGKLRTAHERILNLFARVEVPSYLHSGVRGRSYITNAKLHIGRDATYSLDIQGFFVATKKHHVYRFFKRDLDCSSDIAAAMANLICVDDHLPTGSPLSTLLSYFIHKTLFDRLAALATSNALTMSVYVDDLSFSGDQIGSSLKLQIAHLITSQGLNFHKEKHLTKETGREVTGVIAGEAAVLLPRRRHLAIHEARDALRNAAGMEKEAAYRRLLSRLSEAGQIEPKFKHSKQRLHDARARIFQV